MKVEVINPEVLCNLYKNHGQFACVCYSTPERYAERVGKSCQNDGHMSGSRCEYIKFRIHDIDRGTAEQCLRHEIGVYVPFEYQDNYSFADYSDLVKDISPDQIVKNMASFRYIDKDGFEWQTPALIAERPAIKERYDALMDCISYERGILKRMLEEDGVAPQKATEAVNFVLPRATLSEFVIGMTPEALIHWCHKRLCKRSQEFIRALAKEIVEVVRELNPRFAEELKPQCQHLLWCPEGKRSCGMYPTKEEVRKLIAAGTAVKKKLEELEAADGRHTEEES